MESFDDAEHQLARNLGNEMRRLRERTSLTQGALARKAGHYSRSTIATVETGWGKCSLKLIQGCDEALGADGALVRVYFELKEAQARRKDEARPVFRLADRSPRRTSDGSFILVPSMEPDLIHRPDNLESLVAILVEASAEEHAKAVAVCGPGGFGKTTLATQVCHDARIRELFPEILWVETGEECTAARVVELVSDLCVHLDGARPPLTDPEQAGFHLARILEDRRVLLVIDNVWSAADLAPFLLGGSLCVRLVTTRNVRVCPSTTRLMRLGPMSPQEISELLRRNISAPAGHDAIRLAELCGGWPLLASVVGSNIGHDVAAGAPPDRAVSEAGETLSSHGPQAFDVWDADQRKNAIGQAIMSSLRSLDEHVTITGGSALRDRYLSLAIFPAATAVPLQVLTQWWHRAYGWSRSAVRQFCRVLADRSLVSAYLADRDAILLHDVFRGYLRHLIGDEWSTLHRSLIEAYRAAAGDQWPDLGNEHGYLWRHLSYHLHHADLDDELVGVLASPAHVVTKVVRVGHQCLAADHAVLQSLASFGSKEHPQHAAWQVAKALTGAGYLLHGLKTPADIASTLTVALLREQPSSDSAEPLRQIAADTEDSFHILWTHADQQPTSADGTHGHVGAVVSVTANESLVASGGEDGAVRLWELNGRRLVRLLRGHTGWVFATALSADGEIVASAGEDGVIRLWRTHTGEPMGALTGHTRRIRGLAFASSGKTLVSGAEDGRVWAWDVERLALLRAMDTPGCPVWSVSIGCANTVVAAGGEDEFVRLYELDTGQLLDEKAAHRDWVRSVHFAPEVPLFASGSGDRSVRIWSAADRRLTPVRRIDLTPARVRCVALSERGDLVVSASEDAKIHAFTADGPAGEQQMPPGVDWIRSVALTRDRTVVAGCEDGGLRLWTTTGQVRPSTLGSGSNTVWSTQFADNGRLALLGHGNGLIEARDAVSAAPIRRLSAGPGRVWSLAAGEDQVAAACGDGSVRVWSLRDESWTLQLNAEAARTWAVAIAPSASRLAASAGDGRIRVWTVPSGDLLWEHDAKAGRVRSIAFDESGETLAACGGDGSVLLWHASTGELRGEFANPAGWARTVTIDTPGARLAVGSGVGDIYVRDLASDRFIAHLVGHTGRILLLGFTEDPDRLVSAAADGTVRIWSLSKQRQMAQVRIDASLQCGAFDIDSGRLLASGAAGVAAMTINRGGALG